jgi:glycosyltransferase involved in cell wall biosynthesis
MSDGRPQVSVVIPTRNRWSLLSRCALRSALAQKEVDIEVIVVDDCSTDETPERLARLEESRLRVIRRDGPGNVSAARNAGVAAARGTWVAFLDDDDVWSPWKLRRQLDVAEPADASYVYAGVVVLDEWMRVVSALEPPTILDLATTMLSRYAIPAGCSNVMTRADLLASCGGFDERLRFFADWDLWLRLSSSGRGAACNELLVGYVRHTQSGLFGTARELESEVERLFRQNGSRGFRADPARLLAWTAWEHRRLGLRTRAARLYLLAARRYRRPEYVPRALAALLGVRRPRMDVTRSLDPDGEPSWLGAYR